MSSKNKVFVFATSPLCSLCGEIADTLYVFNECNMFENFRARIDCEKLEPIKFITAFKRANRFVQNLNKLCNKLFAIEAVWKSINALIFNNKDIDSFVMCNLVVKLAEEFMKIHITMKRIIQLGGQGILLLNGPPSL